MSTYLKFPEKISVKQAKEKIEYYCLWGDVFDQYRTNNLQDAGATLARNGLDIDKLANHCRDYKKSMPYISDFLSITSWRASGDIHVQITNSRTGQAVNELSGSGILSMSTYQEKFLKSAEAKNLAVEDDSNASEHILSAIASGFSAIEAYMNMKAAEWNSANPNEMLVDNANNKVNIETKITNWIPKMCNGDSIQTHTKYWSYFKELKKMRDNDEIHPKQSTYAITYKEVAKIIDNYRYGIASLLANIHMRFNQNIPNIVIDSIFYPDVEVIKK